MFGKKKREEDFEEYGELTPEEGYTPRFRDTDGEEAEYGPEDGSWSEDPEEYDEYEEAYAGDEGSWGGNAPDGR